MLNRDHYGRNKDILEDLQYAQMIAPQSIAVMSY